MKPGTVVAWTIRRNGLEPLTKIGMVCCADPENDQKVIVAVGAIRMQDVEDEATISLQLPQSFDYQGVAIAELTRIENSTLDCLRNR
jgi:hypothetical protein